MAPFDESQQTVGKQPQRLGKDPFSNRVYFVRVALVGLVWWLVYSQILPLSQWVTCGVFGFAKGGAAAVALEFFLYDTAKILLLLVSMVYVLAWIRASLSVERVRDFLTGKRRVVGYVLGSTFGAVTPFCSCSSVPLFMGFTAGGIPLGSTMAFLITSPLINEIAIVVLWGLLGWKFTLVYVAVGMLAGIVGGFVMEHFRAERWLQPFLLEAKTAMQGSSGGGSAAPGTASRSMPKPTIEARHAFACGETRDIFRRVWIWVFIGVGVGAVLHGYVPQDHVAATLGKGQWWSVPAAVSVGIPLYTNVTGVIPVMESLLMKGLPLGTTLALCMSTVAVSLPEILMLKQVMRWQLLGMFIGMMLVIFTLVGWFFNAVNFGIV